MFTFKDFDFEVIDVSVQGTADLYVNQTGLTFSKKLLEDMAYPPYVRPLIDAKNKAFAVQVCKQSDDKAVKFSKPRNEQTTGYSTNCNALSRTVRTVMGEAWKDTLRYRITGIYDSVAKAMIFDLSSAEELPPQRSVKKHANT